ncbi:MAG: AAA family ATPase [Bacteroidota bacterium]
MLTRLKVSGFKNLVDIDLRLGPFTCISGSNAVGKSNIFDAIHFLSMLTDHPISEAASMVRAQNGRSPKTTTIKSIFHLAGNKQEHILSFEAEMIIPKKGEDELGQPAIATYNFLKYSLKLQYNNTDDFDNKGPIRVLKEELVPISKGQANKHLLFNHAYKWRQSVIQGKRNVPFISSSLDEEDQILINLHQDGGSSGRPQPFLAKNLPRTVLSTANYASETPTVLLAKREMQSWRLMQLEPSFLRNPDDLEKFSINCKLGSKGEGLPSTIYKLANYDHSGKARQNDNIYVQLANRLSELIQDVKIVSIDKDEKRQILSLQIKTKDGTYLPAKSLSDGTLRFLALAVLDADYSESGLICLEEPENGIYPDRIPAIIDLLQNIAVNPREEDDEYNPLRQIIINTHSPKVVSEIPANSLVYLDLKEVVENGNRFKIAFTSALSDTWRTVKGNTKPITKGKLMAYFNTNDSNINLDYLLKDEKAEKKVKDRQDLNILQGKLF